MFPISRKRGKKERPAEFDAKRQERPSVSILGESRLQFKGGVEENQKEGVGEQEEEDEKQEEGKEVGEDEDEDEREGEDEKLRGEEERRWRKAFVNRFHSLQ
ncbi:hypothetical protein PoB_004320700 [Plakobranchus ocellatus]|uniref:Uncharacterized protein n=1 Tax=Plakobranchus ocellatus TaxID=259542 RepID=A0AAV4BBB1_9GAST|nr:hypothetical protein PoB_004320700 [Plakobranchus ocellatus]